MKIKFFKELLSLKNTILFLLLMLFTTPLVAQTEKNISSLVVNLVEEGFENIAVELNMSDIILTYENRLYRHELDAIERIMELIIDNSVEAEKIILIPQNRHVPLATISIPLVHFKSYTDGNSNRESLISEVDITQSTFYFDTYFGNVAFENNSDLKVDIVIHPHYRQHIGNYDNPYQPDIGIAPAIEMTLGRGFSLTAQTIISIYNELSAEGNYVRPGLLTLNQTIRFPKNIFFSTSLGYFTRHRYGIDLELQSYFLEGRLNFGANLGYTGYAAFKKGKWYTEAIDSTSYFINAGYIFPEWNLLVQFKFGKFIFQDRGYRIDISRQFGEVDLGFYFLKSKWETNGGITFSISIFPKKYYPNNIIRVIPASSFSYQYRAKGLPYTSRVVWGDEYNTGNQISEFKERLTPDYITNYLFK